jgi:RecA-family ATPase
VKFFPGSINLLDPERRAALVEMVRRLEPVLLVVDTMARSMAGGDENSARDVGLVIAATDACRAACPSLAVLIVHHTTKDGDTYRGNSALEGAARRWSSARAPATG